MSRRHAPNEIIEVSASRPQSVQRFERSAEQGADAAAAIHAFARPPPQDVARAAREPRQPLLCRSQRGDSITLVVSGRVIDGRATRTAVALGQRQQTAAY